MKSSRRLCAGFRINTSQTIIADGDKSNQSQYGDTIVSAISLHSRADIPANIFADDVPNAKWLQDDRRVRGDMMLAVSPLQRGFIRDRTTARAAWAKPIETYEPKLAFSIPHLKNELYQCRLAETSAKDAMQALIGRTADFIARLASVARGTRTSTMLYSNSASPRSEQTRAHNV